MIVVDSREKPMVISMAKKTFSDHCKVEPLEAGDFMLCSDKTTVLIERKTITDFIASIYDKRIFQQAKKMSDFAKQVNDKIGNKCYLMLSLIDSNKLGDKNVFVYNTKKGAKRIFLKQINGVLGSLFTSFNIPTFRFKTNRVFMDFLEDNYQRLTSGKKTDVSLRFGISSAKSLKEKQDYFLQGLPHVGSKTTVFIRDNWFNVKHFINSPEKLKEKMPEKYYNDIIKVLLQPFE